MQSRESAANIDYQIDARIDHSAAAIVDRDTGKVGREVSSCDQRKVSACADMACGVGRFIVILNEETKFPGSRDAATGRERDVAAVVDLPICILNKQTEIVHSGQFAADVHTNISARSAMLALVP